MKDQYFGDINDYKKYSLLRLLSGDGQVRIAVCWALTENDGGIDGRRTGYLEQPDIWKKYDPIVYSHLKEEVLDKGERQVRLIEQADVLQNCKFFSEIIHDDSAQRDNYFKKFFEFAEDVDFIFFDPDNGLGVKSVPRGRKGSSKYIYQDEVATAFNSGPSILIYQHFPRKPRQPFIKGLVKQFGNLEDIGLVVSFSSSHVVFLLLLHPRHEKLFNSNISKVAHSWGELIKIGNHPIMNRRRNSAK